MNSEIPRIVFVLGSGISIDAGMPSVDRITENVLQTSEMSAVHVYGMDTDGNLVEYYCLENILPPEHQEFRQTDNNVQRILGFLEVLKAELEEHYQSELTGKKANYEDIYFLASQLHQRFQDRRRRYDNVAVDAFQQKIEPCIRKYLKGGDDDARWTTHELAEKATTYIRDIIWSSFKVVSIPEDFNYLNIFCEAANDEQIESIDFFTLNHDTLLESLFSLNGLAYSDGFEGEESRWNPDLLRERNEKNRILKLHGSTNWFESLDEELDKWVKKSSTHDVPIIPAQGEVNVYRVEPAILSERWSGFFDRKKHFISDKLLPYHAASSARSAAR